MAKAIQTQVVKRCKSRDKCQTVIGRHVYGNLYGINPAVISNLDFIAETVVNAAIAGKMHILELIKRKFDAKDSPDRSGVSVIALIEESHISVHTWPESSYATVDIYSCGSEANPDTAFSYILEKLKPKEYKRYYADRST